MLILAALIVTLAIGIVLGWSFAVVSYTVDVRQEALRIARQKMGVP